MKENKYSLGILFHDEANGGLTHDFFAAVLNGFKKEAEKRGYEITFINNPKDKPGRDTYLQHIIKRGFDGVAIICFDFKDPEVIEVMGSDIPVVTIDEAVYGVISILSDNTQGMGKLVRYIAGQGHKRIAYIHGDMNTVTSLRIQNFKDACEEVGITVTDEYLRQSKFRDMQKTAYETEALLRLPEPPTCIIFPDDYAAIGGINILRARGLEIPEDISVAGYDGLNIISKYEPQITTIRQDMDSMGAIAAERLITLVEEPEKVEIKDVVVETELIKGHTVKKIYL